ncbi:MAG TPA: tRNA 2-thiouridine(34) synthase MnmA [Gammaproteobacteria bacterium]|jgi:tRNA-specific 2-thiouridylase|nr:tRNA 2-thiouridine(34) synthase MnmA [Gammaproteobacteria bacterium]
MSSSIANTHVIVGMSGGVDSSLSAVMLKEAGYPVRGIFMQNWEDDDEHCTIRQDYRDARAVADRIGIELSTVNFAEEYWQRVFAHFLEEYTEGRTPNPDILCNKEIKFRAFLDYAKRQGADCIATGHYAQIQQTNNGFDMLRGVDTGKDQTYFLYTLGQEALSQTLFPIGDMQKTDVRALAERHGLHVHNKKDSTGICFIGERKFNAFLAEYLPASPGAIVTDGGQTLGEHHGLMFYTIGQRQGLGIGGRKDAGEAPWYVLEKDLNTNTLIVGQGHNHPMLFKSMLTASRLHWTRDKAPSQRFTCSAKIRYRQTDQPCTVTLHDDETCSVHFAESVRAMTPGQSVVFYQGEICLGGGVIDRTTRADAP